MRAAVDLAVELVEVEAVRRGALWLDVGVGIGRTLVAEKMLFSVVGRHVVAGERHVPGHAIVGDLDAGLIGSTCVHGRLAALVVRLWNPRESAVSAIDLVFCRGQILVVCFPMMLMMVIMSFVRVMMLMLMVTRLVCGRG